MSSGFSGLTQQPPAFISAGYSCCRREGARKQAYGPQQVVVVGLDELMHFMFEDVGFRLQG